jgi:hypothetical protein
VAFVKATRKIFRRFSNGVRAESATASSVSTNRRLESLSVDVLARVARKSTKDAAARAVAAGRLVAGWRDGMVVDYGLNALRGSVLRYDQPIKPVAGDDWDALRY